MSRHLAFLVALLLGAVLRCLVQVGFSPALIFGDAAAYLSFLDTFEPIADRPMGYSLLVLYPLSWLSDTLLLVTVAHHLMGLATATVVYLLLRRWDVRGWVATLATLPVLFDSLQLLLEQSVLSDVFFTLLLVLGMAALGWRRRPTPALALAAGLLFAAAVTVRLVGQPLVLAGVAFCLLAGRGWHARLSTAAALTVGFVLPLAGYATWYHQVHGVYALSEFGGKSLYIRTTSFVDCSQVSVPQYQRVLCPPEPVGERLDPTVYGWHDDRTVPRLRPPRGTTPNEAMGEFAGAAIGAQPADYARVVVRDFILNFDPWRTDRFEFARAYKWQFDTYVDYGLSEEARDVYNRHGGDLLESRAPYADFIAGYQRIGYLTGPLLLGCLLLGLAGGLGIGRARSSGARSMCLLLTLTGAGLLLLPDITAQFSWRYQLPALSLLPAGAALAFTALRDGRGGQVAALDPADADLGTVATPRTD